MPHRFVSRQPILKGYSKDQKYCVTDDRGRKFLLRISPLEQYAQKKRQYDFMCQAAALGIPMCRPLEFGTSDEGVYSLQTWIDGGDAREIVPCLPAPEQYALGLDAGKILKTLHSIPAPENQPDWESRINDKTDSKIRKYQECPLKYDNGQLFIDFINANRHLLKNRPQCRQHDDYHIGNMMVEAGSIVIIDFDRDDSGDPWKEFKSITWCVQVSPLFASGMVNGYFDHHVPMDFWKLLVLYTSLGIISSLPWAIPYGEGEVHTMKLLADEVLSWYGDRNTPVPAWYQPSPPES